MEERSYLSMLEDAYARLPPKPKTSKRFELPKPIVQVMGTRTFFQNFRDVCQYMNREPNHVFKFLLNELGTAGHISDGTAIFQGKFSEEQMERLLKHYVDDFVVCPVCRRPDTRIEKQGRFNFLICEACGARSSLRNV